MHARIRSASRLTHHRILKVHLRMPGVVACPDMVRNLAATAFSIALTHTGIMMYSTWTVPSDAVSSTSRPCSLAGKQLASAIQLLHHSMFSVCSMCSHQKQYACLPQGVSCCEACLMYCPMLPCMPDVLPMLPCMPDVLPHALQGAAADAADQQSVRGSPAGS